MYNATVTLPGGNEGCRCGIPTLSRAGLVPPPSKSSLPLNPSPAVLDPRPNERNPTYIPMFEVVVMVLELGDTPEDASGQVAAHGNASDAGRGAAVPGKKAHRILTFPWRGG
ncbi:hypothetical protein K474DRAFT_1670560 [Panus rudis PR-1116 ss-1]|nr:hypothetical protein K474DRAFT_1670560 [Panus rudis PR-1116 ss-1]